MDGLASAFAFGLLHSLWQCALLVGAAWFTLRAMVNTSAAARHTVGMGFLVAMALTPLAQVLIYTQADAPRFDGPLTLLLGSRFDAIAAPLLIGAWATGVSFMLLRHAVGLRAIAAIQADASPLPPAWAERAETLRRALGIAQAVAIRVSRDVVTPCLTQLARPVIWLPVSLLTRTPVEQIQALLAHELAHMARRDWLWNGLQCAVETLLFYHPAVWWLSKRIRQEREHACDDLAVAAGGDAIALAEALAGLEQARQAPRLALAANGGALLQRVSRLLSDAPSRGRRAILTILGAIAVTGALLMGQVGVGGGRSHDLIVEASTTGELGPGDYRQITASADGLSRFYRVDVDAQGRLTEIYRENGRARPIDADVRAWIADTSRGPRQADAS